ncbi:hypothetical protein AMECASPLE_038233 [Ameca splendens]|uniref:Uncharacterized protein n=1 Tax=Ameca splendens TaxID=208324 RepID=A0ABV1A4W2_9TELE
MTTLGSKNWWKCSLVLNKNLSLKAYKQNQYKNESSFGGKDTIIPCIAEPSGLLFCKYWNLSSLAYMLTSCFSFFVPYCHSPLENTHLPVHLLPAFTQLKDHKLKEHTTKSHWILPTSGLSGIRHLLLQKMFQCLPNEVCIFSHMPKTFAQYCKCVYT